MKITCKKAGVGACYDYESGKPEGDADMVIYCNLSEENSTDIADMLRHVAEFIENWE